MPEPNHGKMQAQVWVALIGVLGSVALGVVNRLWPEDGDKAQEAAKLGRKGYAATREAVNTLIGRADRLDQRVFRLEGAVMTTHAVATGTSAPGESAAMDERAARLSEWLAVMEGRVGAGGAGAGGADAGGVGAGGAGVGGAGARGAGARGAGARGTGAGAPPAAAGGIVEARAPDVESASVPADEDNWEEWQEGEGEATEKAPRARPPTAPTAQRRMPDIDLLLE